MKVFLQSLPLLGKLFQDITPSEVVAFWNYLQNVYGTSRFTKQDSNEMAILGNLLDALGILNREEFIGRFTTTILKSIYTPFTVGIPSGSWDLWHQVVIGVHEHIHVLQHTNEGLKYDAYYLADSAARARYETEAYRSALEIECWRYRAFKSTPKQLAEKLRNYACSEMDIRVAEKTLELSKMSIEQGAVFSPVTRVAIEWLEAHCGRLKAK